MSISKYAFLALMACASPALAADLTPDATLGPGLSITVPEGFHVTTSGDCPPRQVPIHTPKGISPTESQCLITVTQNDGPVPVTVTAPATTTQLNQKFYFNWSGNNASGEMKMEGTPSGEIQLFPPVTTQAKPPIPSTAEPLSSDRLEPETTVLPIWRSAPVEPVTREDLPPPETAVVITPPLVVLPALPAELVPAPVRIPDPPFTPEGIYQECSRSPYFFTQDQANINYARFRDVDGWDPGRVRLYWKWALYSNACWVMKTY